MIYGHVDRPLAVVMASGLVWVHPCVDIGMRIGCWCRCWVSEVLRCILALI